MADSLALTNNVGPSVSIHFLDPGVMNMQTKIESTMGRERKERQ
jgi:hypothetical protein